MKSRPRKTIIAIAILIVLAVLAIPACQSPGSDPALPVVTPQQVALIESQLQQSREALTALPAEDPGRIAAEKKITELEKLVTTYKANLEKQAASGIGEPEASITAGAQTVAPFLPPPWNAVALIAGGLLPGVLGWVRESQLRRQTERAGQDLARAIKAAAIANGGVLDFTDLTVRESLKAAMPDDARAIVKDAGANVPLPFIVETPPVPPVSTAAAA